MLARSRSTSSSAYSLSIPFQRSIRASLAQVVVCGQGQELGELLAERHLLEDFAGVVPAPAVAQPFQLRVLDGVNVTLVDLAVAHPLPDLGARDLGRGSVLHQVVDGDRADASQPGLQLLETDADVVLDPGLGDLAARHRDVEESGRVGRNGL